MKKLILLFFVFVSMSSLGGVMLAWDPSPPEQDVVKYTLYWGTSSGAYLNDQKMEILSPPSAPVNEGELILPGGKTYFVAVTATNVGGLESGYSNEISFSVPAGPTNLRLKVQVQTSSNGKDWKSLAEVNDVDAENKKFWRIAVVDPATVKGGSSPAYEFKF